MDVSFDAPITDHTASDDWGVAILEQEDNKAAFDVCGHLFTRAGDDFELFDKLEKDLMAA